MKSKNLLKQEIIFKELFAIPIKNGIFKPVKVRGSGTKMINMGEIFANDRIFDIPMEFVPLTQTEEENAVLKKNDLLFARASLADDAGKCSIFLGDEKTTFESHIIRIRINTKIANPKFYYYYFNSILGKNLIYTIAEKTAASGIRGSDLANLLVPLFPKNIQDKVANYLEILDTKIINLQNQNKVLDQIAQVIFKSWFTDFDGHTEFDDSELGQIPKGWKIKQLWQMCTTQYGYTASSNNEAIGPKYLRITDMNKTPWINWERVPYCKITDSNFEKYSLKKGDLIISRMADTGKAGIVEDEISAVFASYLVRLKTQSIDQSYFLFYFMRSKKYLDYAAGVSGGGTVQKNMNAKVITSVELIVPPNELIKSFFELVHPIRINIINNIHRIQLLTKIRDTIFLNLMSGEN